MEQTNWNESDERWMRSKMNVRFDLKEDRRQRRRAAMENLGQCVFNVENEEADTDKGRMPKRKSDAKQWRKSLSHANTSEQELIKTKMLQTIMQLMLFSMMIALVKNLNNKKLIKFSFYVLKHNTHTHTQTERMTHRGSECKTSGSLHLLFRYVWPYTTILRIAPLIRLYVFKLHTVESTMDVMSLARTQKCYQRYDDYFVVGISGAQVDC